MSVALEAARSAPLTGAKLRSIASPETPRASTLLGVVFALGDVTVYVVGAATFVAAPWWAVKLLGVGASGVAVAMLFALGHDAAHGSLAGSRLMNRLLATICFVPSWYPYTPWVRGHNHLHHGWTNVAECDYAWRPVSPSDYRTMSSWRRTVERAYRSWWGLWMHSIVEIWWKHMAMPGEGDRQFLHAGHLAADRLLVAASVVALGIMAWLTVPEWSTSAGGPRLSPVLAVIGVIVAPWWIFHVLFSIVTFLHHTHPRVPWFRSKHEASFAGQVRATVHVELPVWLERLLHNITVHSAHHVDARIPFRSLPEAQRRIESAFSEDVIVERWSLRLFISVTRSCQLYDYDAHEWRSFGSA